MGAQVSRIDFEFVGTTSAPLSLEPAEFAGKTVPQVTDEIMKLLREIKPDVSFFEDDLVLAADALLSANGTGA